MTLRGGVGLCLLCLAPAAAQTPAARPPPAPPTDGTAADSAAAVDTPLMPPTRYGIVRAYLPDDAGAAQVAVSRGRYLANFGSRDGVRPGSIFQVYSGQTYVGLLRVEETYRDSATLSLVELERKVERTGAAPVRRGYLLYPHYVLLESVNFGTGKPDFSADMHQRLRYATRFILNNPDFPVLLEGHTDNTGKKADNVTLAIARAQVVRDYLHDIQRVPLSQMVTVGYADEQPIASNRTEEGRHLNRRVDVVMVRQLPPEALAQRARAATAATEETSP